MLRDSKAMMTVAFSLITLAVASKLLIPRDLPWRFPGGWPFGSVYHRYDTVAFRLLFGAGVIVGILALLRASAPPRS
jgi:hypothetical protein